MKRGLCAHQFRHLPRLIGVERVQADDAAQHELGEFRRRVRDFPWMRLVRFKTLSELLPQRQQVLRRAMKSSMTSIRVSSQCAGQYMISLV